MYPLDEAAQNACLDALLGDAAGSSMPTAFEVALFFGDPLNGGVELDAVGNYLRPTIDNDTAQWPNAADGVKVSAVVAFADPTDKWTADGTQNPATHFLLYDAADSTTAYLSGRLDDELNVYGSETNIALVLSVYWDITSSEDL